MELIATVEQTGCTAPPTAPSQSAPGGDPEEDTLSQLRLRLWISVALAVPVVALAMAPVPQLTNWQWLSALLAAPVVVYGGWPFHKAAWANLRHAAATMDTLISIGTLAAFGWSMYALFFGTAGEPGMTHPFALISSRLGARLLPWPQGLERPAAGPVLSFRGADRHTGGSGGWRWANRDRGQGVCT